MGGEVVVSSHARPHCIEEDERAHGFDQIVGHSTGLESVLAEVERVAPTDCTALVLGETGSLALFTILAHGAGAHS